MNPENADAPTQRPPRLPLLVLGALGVVYGDIGTSPLYALRECFTGNHHLAVNEANVFGILSLIFWALILVISLKYMVFVMRADNDGEGGILALMVLALSKRARDKSWGVAAVMAMGLFGGALLYGDGMITPAISVLSAIEGLNVATPFFAPYVIPITLTILVLLFCFQSHGTSRLGGVFGPIILLWFVVLAVLGVLPVMRHPHVLLALNPYFAVNFMLHGHWEGFLVLGAVFLVVTGGEALYADMGHFGRLPIRAGWFAIVLPALVLNYFGQGALILENPSTVENPFYALAPGWALYPLVGLATLATIIASQAVISGAFSLTRQAVLLDYLPRVTITHTSPHEIGQIYIPLVNWLLLSATICLVLGFQTSSNIASAYGVAVTTTMLFTTALLFVVSRRLWKWSIVPAVIMACIFLVFDLGFFGAAMLKIFHGGWVPLLIAIVVYTLFTTWRRGRQLLRHNFGTGLPIALFVENITEGEDKPVRVPGAAVFMSGNPDATPRALLHNLKYNRVLHERVVIMSILIEDHPHVPLGNRVAVDDLGHGFYRVVARYGFTDSPSVPEVLECCRVQDLQLEIYKTAFFLGRETIISTKRRGMARWRERIFVYLSRNAQGATRFFDIPANRVIELGIQVEI